MFSVRWLFLLLVLTAMVAASGCATTETENTSSRPWNQPQGWETGMPGGFYQGQHY